MHRQIKTQEHQLFFYYWNICQQLLCCIYSRPKGLSHEVIQRHAQSLTQQGMLAPWQHGSFCNHKPLTLTRWSSSDTTQRERESETKKKWSSGQRGDTSATPTAAVCLHRVFIHNKTIILTSSACLNFLLYSGLITTSHHSHHQTS